MIAPLRGDRMRQPADARVDAEPLEERGQDLIERPAVDVDHREIVADDDRHDHHRHQEYGGIELPRSRAPRHEHRQHEADDQLERDGDAGEVEGAPERQPELIVGEHRLVVLEAGEAGRLERTVGAPLQQADPDRQDERDQYDQDEQRLDEHERDEAEHALGGEPPREAAHGSAARHRRAGIATLVLISAIADCHPGALSPGSILPGLPSKLRDRIPGTPTFPVRQGPG